MACLHLIKCCYIAYVQIHKQYNKCFYSQTSTPHYIHTIAYSRLYKNTVLLLGRHIKPGIGLNFK